MLELNHVEKTYHDRYAVRDFSLQLPEGEIVGLFGENGAGKTTLMKCILGYLRHSGTITLDGAPITHRNIAQLSFATCEHSFFPELTPLEHREFLASQFPNFRGKRFDGLMDFFELPKKRPLRQYSTGQKNQFEVIAALSQGARYILMDEPFSGNDVFNREDFYKVLLGILEERETVILSTHLLEEVENFIGRAVLIREGKLVGDASMLTLQEQGKSLLTYVKETYHYEKDRVSRALEQMTGEEPS